MKKILKYLVTMVLIFAVLCSTLVISVNAYVKKVGTDAMRTTEEATQLKDVDCIIIYGCLVLEDGTPCNVLKDRLDKGIELYKKGAAPKIIMSGDHSSDDYNEVAAMKQYAINAGVPSEDIFMDHEGYSTYETAYRAKEVFGAKKVILVTQKYHLYRAVYIAESLGIEAYGVASDYEMHESREVFARCKDFITSMFKPAPANLGIKCSLSGNGNMTNAA